jgi:hypothetical protein
VAILDVVQKLVPDLFVKGAGLCSAHFSSESPLGTIQSIEYALRSLDKLADQEQDHKQRLEKNLADYQAQASKPFEHEARNQRLDRSPGAIERAVRSRQERSSSRVGG